MTPADTRTGEQLGYLSRRRIAAGKRPPQGRMPGRLATLGMLLWTGGLLCLHAPLPALYRPHRLLASLPGCLLMTLLLPLGFLIWYLLCDKPAWLREGRIGWGRFSLPLWLLCLLPLVWGVAEWLRLGGPDLFTLSDALAEGAPDGVGLWIDAMCAVLGLTGSLLTAGILLLCADICRKGRPARMMLLFPLAALREVSYLAIHDLRVLGNLIPILTRLVCGGLLILLGGGLALLIYRLLHRMALL